MSGRPYQEYYRERLERAWEFQDFVNGLFFDRGIVFVSYQSKKFQFERGENSGGIEIKYDERFETTGNLYIECAEKSHPEKLHFIPSGIYRLDDSWLYAIGDYRIVYIFATKHLRWLRERKSFVRVEIATSQGFLLPEIAAKKYSILTLNRVGAEH